MRQVLCISFEIGAQKDDVPNLVNHCSPINESVSTAFTGVQSGNHQAHLAKSAVARNRYAIIRVQCEHLLQGFAAGQNLVFRFFGASASRMGAVKSGIHDGLQILWVFGGTVKHQFRRELVETLSIVPCRFEVTEFGEVFGSFVSVGSANSSDQFEFGSGKHLFGREGSSNDPVDAVRGKLLLNNRDAAVTAELLEGFFPATWNGTMIVSNEFRTRYALAGLSKRGGVNEVNDLPELRLAEILNMGTRPDVQN